MTDSDLDAELTKKVIDSLNRVCNWSSRCRAIHALQLHDLRSQPHSIVAWLRDSRTNPMLTPCSREPITAFGVIPP